VEGEIILQKVAAIWGNPNAASAGNLVIKLKSVGVTNHPESGIDKNQYTHTQAQHHETMMCH